MLAVKISKSFGTAILIPPAGPGSLGDEAMLSAACTELKRKGVEKVIMMLPGACVWSWTFGIDGVVTREQIGPLITQGRNGPCRRAGLQISRIVAIGADIVDGAYGKAYPLFVLRLLHHASRAGINSTLAGFSLNQDVDSDCERFLKALSPEVRLCSRDPISRTRAEHIVDRPVLQTADMAFLLEPEITMDVYVDAKNWISSQRQHADTLIGINVNSHHLDRVSDLAEAYIQLVEKLANTGRISFVFIPHDMRDNPSDVEMLGRIFNGLKAETREKVLLIGYGISASVVKAIVGLLDIVVTGRMHLGIASLGQTVPALCVDYQGKVEGLYDLLGLPDMSISMEMLAEPDTLSKWIMRKIEARLPISCKLASSINNILYKSRLNIE